jgi:hypothetical protein
MGTLEAATPRESMPLVAPSARPNGASVEADENGGGSGETQTLDVPEFLPPSG